MTNFAHVTDTTVRQTLSGDFSNDSLCLALTATGEALDHDRENPDLPAKVLSAREEAFNNADYAWNEEGDAACIEALRRFWSI